MAEFKLQLRKERPATIQEYRALRDENERLRATLATVRNFIDGEMIAHAIVVPEGASVSDPNNPTLLKLIDVALGFEQSSPKTRE